MNTVETRIRTTSTHPAVDARLGAAARLAREATMRHTAAEACRAVVDALSAPSLEFEGIGLRLYQAGRDAAYQVVAGTWPPAPTVEAAAIFTMPLMLDDERIGELTVYRQNPEGLAEADAALITAAAAHASLGVARARLLEQVAALTGDARRKRPSARATQSKSGPVRRVSKHKASSVRRRASGKTRKARGRAQR